MKILITGGAKRIGRMLSEHLAKHGHEIAIHYNSSSDDAQTLLSQLGGKESGHTTIQSDLSNTEEAEKLIGNLTSNWTTPDLVINNASTYFRRGMTDFTNEELLEDYTVNFFSPLIIMREFKKISGKGKIINFIDRRVNIIEPEAGPYALAKKSLRDATLACAEEWSPEIKVNAIAPGPVLLPGESPDNAKYKSLLLEIKANIDKLITSEKSGSIIVIE